MTNIEYKCDICGKEINIFHREIRFGDGFLDLCESKLELCSHCYNKVKQAITKTAKELKKANKTSI